jgi:hypothetical protein
MFSVHMGLCIMLEGWPLASNSIMLNDAQPDDNTIKKESLPLLPTLKSYLSILLGAATTTLSMTHTIWLIMRFLIVSINGLM